MIGRKWILAVLPALIFSCTKPGERDRDKLSPEEVKKYLPYPHTKKYKESGVHGKVYLENRGKILCQTCHGKDFKGGDTKFSCYKCHDFPHAGGWKEGERHGKKFILTYGKGGKDVISCMNCHDMNSSLRKENTGVAVDGCKKCHKLDIPHTKEFVDVMHHSDHKNLATRYLDQCRICHMDKNENKPYFMHKYKRFIYPGKIHLEKAKECAACHNRERIEEEKLIVREKWNKKLHKYAYTEKLLRDMNENINCVDCHRPGKEPVFIEKDSLEGEYNTSCALCHKPGEVAKQKFRISKKELEKKGIDNMELKNIEIEWKRSIKRK